MLQIDWRAFVMLHSVTPTLLAVTDAELEHLKGLRNLEGLVLVDTQVAAQGVDKLRKALPNCLIHWPIRQQIQWPRQCRCRSYFSAILGGPVMKSATVKGHCYVVRLDRGEVLRSHLIILQLASLSSQ
jgi:hypothetical protein